MDGILYMDAFVKERLWYCDAANHLAIAIFILHSRGIP